MRFLFLCLLLMGMAPLVWAQDEMIRVRWNENPESDIAGYRVYWGTTPGSYQWSRDVGSQTICDLTDLQADTRYFIAVTARDYWGNESAYSAEVEAVLGESPTIPMSMELSSGYPNPVRGNRSTWFQFSLPDQKSISITIYNVLGQKVAELEHREFPAGSYRTFWNGLDDTGRPAPPGSYFCRLKSGDTSIYRTLIRLP